MADETFHKNCQNYSIVTWIGVFVYIKWEDKRFWNRWYRHSQNLIPSLIYSYIVVDMATMLIFGPIPVWVPADEINHYFILKFGPIRNPNWLLIQPVPRALTSWVKQLEQEADQSLPKMSNIIHPFALSSPVTGLVWPIGFQEVKVPRFHDNSTGWW
jgi:hypothetical protein